MWEQIQANRRRSVVFVTAMVAVLLVLGYVCGEAIVPRGGPVGMLVALGVWCIQMMVYFAAGESILLHSAGAHELKREDSPRLFNIVEEMKLASGLEFMPRIYLVDSMVPNAFAVGRKAATSAVAVTTGLMHRLNRDELQGVIAHEMGHLKNRDVKFMTLAAVLLGSIILLTELFWRALRGIGRGSRRSSSRGAGQAQLVFLLIAIVCAVLAPLLAQMLYFACSRKREYLADASAAQFTRYPAGLASALEKISRSQGEVDFASKATAPMFIVNPLQAEGGGFVGLFSTHPPTSERVRILRSMAGAGLADYEDAFRKAKGASPLIGPASLQQSPHEEIRSPSAEKEDGEFGRRGLRAMMHRLDGYVPITCGCGLQTRVPPGYRQNEIRCVRCGSLLAVPAAREQSVAVLQPVEDQSAAPLAYQRKTAGWESFRCGCGQTLQLSPSFRGNRLTCNKCGQRVEIEQTA